MKPNKYKWPTGHDGRLTNDKNDDEGLNRGGIGAPFRGSVPVRPGLHFRPVLLERGHGEEDEETAERGRVVEELHERRPDHLAQPGFGEEDVGQRQDGPDQDQEQGNEDVEEGAAVLATREALVPDGGQQLLTMRMGHKLKYRLGLHKIA